MLRYKRLVGVAAMYLILTCGVLAQEEELGLVAMSGPDGVVVLLGPHVLHPDDADRNGGKIGYHVYRRVQGEQDFVRLTGTPVSRVFSYGDLESALGPNIEGLLKFLNITGKATFWQLFKQGDEKIAVVSMFSPELREMMGLLYRDTDVELNRTYEYAVAFAMGDGTESQRSFQVPVTVGKPPFTLQGPVDLSGELRREAVNLTWKSNPADTGAIGFSVYRALRREGPFSKLNRLPIIVLHDSNDESPPNAAYLDTTVVAGVEYFYGVVSLDYAGNESPRDSLLSFIPATVAAPATPQIDTTFSTPNGIAIRWKMDSVASVAGYDIWQAQDPDSGFVQLNDVLLPANAKSYLDRSPFPSRLYYYRVSAVGANGRKSQRSGAASGIFVNKQPPMPPGNVRATASRSGVLIEWQKNEEPDLLCYYVYRSDKKNGELYLVSKPIPPDSSAFLDMDDYLSAKGKYWYVVRAMNRAQAISDFSLPATASPNAHEQPQPPLSFYGVTDATGNRLFWKPPPDNTISGYHIYRAAGADSSWQRLSRSQLTANALTFTDSSAAAAMPYRYHIRSINIWEIEGRPSHAVTLVRHAPPPLPPSNLLISPLVSGVKLSWDRSLDRQVQGYVVWRRSGGSKRTMLTAEPLPRSSAEFRDETAISGTRYYYSVSCVGADNHAGKRSLEVAFKAP